jgi:O-methyltransferase involved in polyketide biosynthesis
MKDRTREDGEHIMTSEITSPEHVKVELGSVQKTLFIPLAARARETRRRRPVLRDPKAAEILASVDFDAEAYSRGWGGSVTVLRTAIFDCWVSGFLAEHPGGTVVEIGTGLNTRFERAGGPDARWIDLDLPDTIELRRKFFTDSAHRQMVAASVLDPDWLPAVRDRPGPYFFAAERRAWLPGAGSAGPHPHRQEFPRRADRLRHLQPEDAPAPA